MTRITGQSTSRGEWISDVTVVIPTYNRSKLIVESIKAILAQTFPPSEIIVVDDGSTDNTETVVGEFGPRIAYMKIPNSGDLVARNVGLRAAKQRFVAFCDSDDVWLPDFLESMLDQWRDGIAMTACYSNFRILKDGVLSDASKLDAAPPEFWSGWQAIGPDAGRFVQPCIRNLLAFQPLFPSCMVVDREGFQTCGGWDESVSRLVGCDLATALRVAAKPPVGLVLRPLVAIRKHSSNISGDTERMNLGDARVLEQILTARPELAPLAHDIRQSVELRRRQASDSAFSRRDFETFQEVYSLLPQRARSLRLRIKRALTRLPPPLRDVATALIRR